MESAYFLMSDERKEKCNAYLNIDDKKRCICADMLLRSVLCDKLKLSSEKLEFGVNGNGKPYLINGELKFNISHSGDYVAVAVNENKEVGIDIEKIREISAHTAKHIFSDSDKLFVFQSENIPRSKITDPQTLVRFFKVWTYKEAYSKMTGEGITDNLKNISYDENRCTAEVFDNYVLTVVTDK